MSETVERVAQAIKALSSYVLGGPIYDTDYSAIARAAIAAMREPTEAMIDAAIALTPTMYEIDSEDRAAYGVMIRSILDVALKD